MIVIVGFMGAGKTTVGQLLAAKLGLPFTDIDVVIERRAGRSIPQIFATEGEPAFRALEHETTAEFLGGPDAVLALGGGAVEHLATRQVLRRSHVIYLKVTYEESMLRIAHDEHRPMLRSPDLQAIFQRRLASYEAVATQIIAADGRPPDAVCLDILGRLPARPG